MAKEDEPIPQEKGQLVPPRRRPPIAVAVDTLEPPGKRSLWKIVKQIAETAKQKLRTALSWPATGGYSTSI